MDYINVGSLAVWHHLAETETHGRVLLVHGICEHSGRHINTIRALTAMGFDVIRFDLRGSGKSGGRRQYIETFSDYCEDVLTVFNWLCTNLPPQPCFLMGHSLGGAIALHTAPSVQRLLTGLVLSAPAYVTGNAVSNVKIVVGRFINRFLPTFTVPASSDNSSISRNPEVVEAYAKDPLSSHFHTVRQGDEVLKAIDKIPELLPQIHIPIFIAHGSHDRMIRLEGSFDIMQKVSSNSRLLYIIPGGYHEPHNDLCMDEYLRALGFWLTSQVTKTEEPACRSSSPNARTTIPPQPAPQ
jgi:alpha-beta hydrolase superfamily lysophospholipase